MLTLGRITAVPTIKYCGGSSSLLLLRAGTAAALLPGPPVAAASLLPFLPPNDMLATALGISLGPSW